MRAAPLGPRRCKPFWLLHREVLHRLATRRNPSRGVSNDARGQRQTIRGSRNVGRGREAMMRALKALALALGLVAFSGCFHIKYTTKQTPAPVPNFDQWHH